MSEVPDLFRGGIAFEPPPDDALVAAIEAELGRRLPAAYIALARQHNGGDLARSAHPADSPTTWAADHVAVTSLAAIGRTAHFSLCGEVGSAFWVSEWGYPDIGIYFADCPSAGHDMIALDYREPGEPSVVHVDQEVDYRITKLAPDFATFISGLVDDSAFDEV
jgi:SMI1-KNR4 cell-wall